MRDLLAILLLDLLDTLLPSSFHPECCGGAVQVVMDLAMVAEKLESDHQAGMVIDRQT